MSSPLGCQQQVSATGMDVEDSLLNCRKPSGRIIRFGLRASTGLGSPLWRMWVQGDETYLAMRTAIGISKISLHSSGKWVFTAGTGRVKINGPRRLNDNWSVGPRIVFPGLPPTIRLATYERGGNGKCFLFESPPTCHWRDFAVLFSEPSADPKEIVRLLPQGVEAIGPLPLRSDSVSWLATFITTMTPTEIQYINSERAKFRVTVTGGIDSMRAPWANLIQDIENGDTMIVNIELGRDNIALAS